MIIRSTVLLAVLLAASDAFAAPRDCSEPARLLAEAPERLVACTTPESSPELRTWAAHATLSLGQPARAAEMYRSLAKEPALATVRPVLLLSAARALLQDGRAAQGLELLPPPSDPPWLRAEIAAARADLALATGDAELARRSASEALALGHPSADALEMVRLQASLALEDGETARDVLTTLRTKYPESPLAREAEPMATARKLPALDSLSPELKAERWRRLAARGGASSVVAECLPQMERPHPKNAAWARAELACGNALSTLRHSKAEAVLRRAATRPAVRLQALDSLVRVLSRGTDPAPVEKVCTEIAAEPKSTSPLAECRYLAAFMRLSAGDETGARKSLDAVVEQFPTHSRGNDAAWMLALEDFRQDRPASTKRFRQLAATATNAQARARALYWLARSLPDDARDEARAAWNEALKLDPLGYYGWLASARLNADRHGPPRLDACRDVQQPEPAEAPPAARLAQALLDTGYKRFAAEELTRLVSPRRRDALSWAPYLRAASQYVRLLDIGLAHGKETWPVTEATRPGVEARYPIAFPLALESVPEPVDRCLVLAIMRRESRFDPDAASAAQARGLLQLIPPTASRLAEELAIGAIRDEQLFDPGLNVKLAGQYLSRLQQRFKHPFLVAAAYNAGPNAVVRWTRQFAGMEPDEWAERITYRETRLYVRAVGGAYAAYSRLYGGALPPLNLEPFQPAADGVDY